MPRGLSLVTLCTPFLLTANLLVFVAMVLKGVPLVSPKAEHLIPWGANYGPLTLSGQWWRMASAIFLHFGIAHLLMNMFALLQVAAFIEAAFGAATMLSLFMVSGVAGSVVGLAWHPHAAGAGASGAIFGLFGALMAFLLRHADVIPKERRRSLQGGALLFVAFNLLMDQSSPVIDSAAHLGGLAAGFSGGLLVSRLGDRTGPLRFAGPVFLGLASAGLIAAAPAVLPHPADFPREVQRFSDAQQRLSAAYNQDLEQLRTKTLGTKDFTERVRRDVIASWIAERQRLASVTGFSKNQQARISELVDFMRMREEAWSKFLDGLERHDAKAIRQSNEMMQKADAFMKTVAAGLKRPVE